MKKILICLIAIAALAAISCSRSPERMTLIDDDWEFCLDGDKHWTPVDLPHDWSALCDFDSLAPAGNDGGYLPTGKGIYRKTLAIDKPKADRRYGLLFEGCYMDAKVYLNGQLAGEWPYGYSSFHVDPTPYLRSGNNALEVHIDNSRQKNCRWYTGSGIYRHVWLTNTADTYVSPWSLAITTPSPTKDEATVDVKFNIINTNPAPRYVKAKVSIAKDNRTLGHETLEVAVSDTTEVNVSLKVDNPELWSPENPALYQAQLILTDSKGVVDEYSTEFGIRQFDYSATEGLKLNGESILLNGGCVHHDNGVLGAASYDAAERRKVALLKEAGFNAVRTSHNPPAPAFLRECDRQGLIVIDEAFDGWKEAKNPNDYAVLFDQWALMDAEAMVRRDRNHPSILAWSIGNEILERKAPEAVEIAHELAECCRTADPSRPVTQALASWDADWEIYDPLAAEHDIIGYNYMIHKAESDHERVPDRVMWQTESYPRDAFQNWEMVNDHPYVIGDFVWTAIDYLGESGIGRHYYEGESEGEHWERNQWPWHGALCGDIDLTGNRRPISYYREMLYSTQPKLVLAVREPNGYKGQIKETLWGTYPASRSWNWRGHEGEPIQVVAATKADSVTLYLNDAVVGKAAVGRGTAYKAVFTVPYTPGTLRAVASDGQEQVISTAGEPVAIRLASDCSSLKADNQDLAYVIAELIDEDGRIVPDSDMVIDFDIEGNGKLLATGSADMKDPMGYHRSSRLTHEGRALAVVKAGKHKGQVLLKAKTDSGLEAQHIITIK